MKTFNQYQVISLISFLIFSFFIPFGWIWTNIFLFLSVLFVLLDKNMYSNFGLKKLYDEETYFLIGSSVYFVYCIISIFWSEDIGRGVQLIGRYTLIIVFPFFLTFMKSVGTLKNYKLPFCAFCFGVLVSSVVCLYLSYQNCWQKMEDGVVFRSNTDSWDLSLVESISLGVNHFSYNLLSHFIHPSYFSLYVLFAFIFVLNEFSNIKQTKYRLCVCFLCLYFICFIYLLQCRSNFFALVLVAISYTICYSFQKRKFLFLAFVVLGFVFIIPKLIKHSRFDWIVSELIDVFKTNDASQKEQKLAEVNDRIIIWRNAFQVIKENPILGVGIGDTDTELEKQYKKNGVEFEYGTHNQYIYAQLSMGIVGLILLLAMLFTPLYFGIKNRYFPLIGFSVAVMINLLFENMLTRNAGLMFIPWATMLLLMMSEEKKNELAK